MSIPMTSSAVKPTAVFKALDWSIPAWKDRSPVLLCSGSAGGGKSKFAAEKVNAYMKRYPGSTGLMVRKVKDSMKNSTVLFFKFNVLGAELGKSVWHIESKDRFEYANGSILSYGGMWNEEQREALRSIGQDGGLGICWLEEATRFIEDDYNELIPRMRETKGDFRQMILTTNPGSPNHWIYQRLILGGEASVYYSGALDNPNNPPEYVDNLRRLTGILKKRLVDGLWVQAEGVVYDNFNPDEGGNVTEAADYDPSKPVLWGVDDGYAYGQGPGTLSYHPRVILLAQETAQGGMNIFAEYYACQELGETSIDNVLGLGYPAPEQVYIDSSAAELRGRLWGRGFYVVPSTHEVSEGIKNVRRMMCDGNGVRLLQIHPRCKQLINELLNYQYDENSTTTKAGERKPLKLDDHGCFVAGTLIETLEGQKPIEDVRIGDYVLTRVGYHRVYDSAMTDPSAETYTATFADGRTLKGTGNHPIWVSDKGYISLQNLQPFDKIVVCSRPQGVIKWLVKVSIAQRKLFSTVSSSVDTPIALTHQIGTISARTLDIFGAALGTCIAKSGKRLTDQFRRGTIFTTQTGTPSTTTLTTSFVYPQASTNSTTPLSCLMSESRSYANGWIVSDTLPWRGTSRRKAAHGIENTAKRLWQKRNTASFPVNIAVNSSLQKRVKGVNSAQTTANQHGGGQAALTTSRAFALFVRMISKPIVTLRNHSVQLLAPKTCESTVVSVVRNETPKAVYNLSVETAHEYFAGGVCVSNCDVLRYVNHHLRFT